MVRRKRILIHSIVFSPDGVSTAYLYNDIALAFSEQGYEVVVITTTPHYNIVASALERQPMKQYAGGLFYKSNFHGIPVYHVPQKKFKSFVARALGFIYWHIVSFFLGLAQKNVSVILSPSPPLTIGFISILIGWIKKAKVIYNVQEIYPDLLINQGSLRSPLLLNLLRRLERFVYNYSDKVVTIDQVFYNTIVGRFKDPAKLAVIPNFVDTDIYRPHLESVSLLDRVIFPENDKLKVLYAGNIGHAQDWGPLVAIAMEMLGKPVEFFVVGEGIAKQDLAEKIVALRLENLHLLPYQAREMMPPIVNYADIHFIFMSPSMEGQGFPSKVYTILACKKPLLVLTGKDTPLYNFLDGKQCAFLISERSELLKVKTVVEVLNRCLEGQINLAEMGENAFKVIEDNYSKKAVTWQYVSLCNGLLEPEKK